MKQKRGPHATVKSGNVTIPIYRVQNKGYVEFRVVWYDAEHKRKMKAFADEREARKYASTINASITSGEAKTITLTEADRFTYLEAKNALAGQNIPLNVAAREYADAMKRLAPVSLKEAVDFWIQHNAGMQTRTVTEAVNELIASKRNAKLSAVHLKDLESRLGKFSEDFQVNIGGVSRSLLQQWIDNLNGSGRTKENYLRHVSTLFRFAIKRKYLPKSALDEIEAVQLPKADDAEVEVFTAAEMREILAVARVEMIPFIAIAGFAGLRSAEIARLDWSKVNLAERHITIDASVAKTGSRRVVPILQNLFSWLEPHAKKAGKVCPFASWWNEVAEIPAAVNAARIERGLPGNFRWKHNALRHGFCSYRLALCADVPRVSYEAGNSPAMIHQHYKSLVSEQEGKAWFAIVPEVKQNIIPMAATA